MNENYLFSSKVEKCKTNTQKSVLFLHINSEKSEK
jgi:hypothetical protein